MPVRIPAFTEAIPGDCACALCADGAAAVAVGKRRTAAGPVRHRCALRGAIAVAVGAVVLAGPGVGAVVAAPQPGPGQAESADAPPAPPLPHPGAVSAGGEVEEGQGAAEAVPESEADPDAVDAEAAEAEEGDAEEEGAEEGDDEAAAQEEAEEPADESGPADQDEAQEPPAPPEPSQPEHPQRPAAGRRDLEPAIAFAMAHIGDPYVLGGVGPHRWDCSGLIQKAYRKAGARLPRIAADQYRATARIPRSALRRGDIVFWSSNGKASGVHHAAIYLGGKRYIEAPRPGKKVRISTFAHYNPNLYGRVR
ncbi:C40 family peptidase [Streptomyces sp. NPDC001407]|uniref:C40 family peptidase n=1 Tax=unclassified Streptomyces TaxID=2593676 RepID=UPI00367B130D